MIDVVYIIVFATLLFCASITDIKEKIILNFVPISITIIGILRLRVIGLCGLLIVGGIWLLICALSNGKLGMGDVKLMAACGAFLGVAPALYQSAVGCFIAVAFNLAKSRKNKDIAIPLAPYLSLAGMLMLILEII